MPLSSTSIVKVIVVTDDLEKTVTAYRKLFGTGKPPEEEAEHKMIREPYTKYLGKDVTELDIKVESVFSDNFWFEIIQPVRGENHWSAWLKEHGTSICTVCHLTDGPLEKDEALMAELGYQPLFKQEKGYEAYEYFDTSADLGVMTEVKEHY